MRFLTLEEVIQIHDSLIKQFGGSAGIRDLGALRSATVKPQMSFKGQELL